MSLATLAEVCTKWIKHGTSASTYSTFKQRNVCCSLTWFVAPPVYYSFWLRVQDTQIIPRCLAWAHQFPSDIASFEALSDWRGMFVGVRQASQPCWASTQSSKSQSFDKFGTCNPRVVEQGFSSSETLGLFAICEANTHQRALSDSNKLLLGATGSDCKRKRPACFDRRTPMTGMTGALKLLKLETVALPRPISLQSRRILCYPWPFDLWKHFKIASVVAYQTYFEESGR